MFMLLINLLMVKIELFFQVIDMKLHAITVVRTEFSSSYFDGDFHTSLN